jgi:DNA processing protein
LEIPCTQQDHCRPYGRDRDRRSTERSGALITADFALEDGREVFAVPGEITGTLSTGTNRLLRQGATPLTTADDVLELFGLAASQRPQVPTVGPSATAVLERLTDGAASADELARTTGLGPGPLAAALAELELAGLASEADGRYRAVVRPG